MNTEDFTQFVGTVGFPVAVAGYVLIRLEKTMQELTKAVQALTASRKGDV